MSNMPSGILSMTKAYIIFDMLSMTLRTVAVSSLITAALLGAEPRVESNQIYGMYSGAALLMDVHIPARPNGYGVVFISGSGWHAPQEYGASELKSGSQIKMYGPPLVAAGYTVFSLNHRAAPRFRF